jgi:predicted nucleic acid-binding protein
VKTPLRVYADTSVLGGCFDREFNDESRAFFEQVSSGKLVLLISDLTVRELQNAPREVREFYLTLADYESVSATDECYGLRDAYLRADVLGRASADDALHVAIATVYRADIVVSWNFKHIVQRRRIRGFEAVNALMDYRSPEIFSPREIIEA